MALEAQPMVDPDPDAEPRRLVAWLVGSMLAFVAIALAWAIWAQLDVAVQGRGAVVPPSRLQEVQSLEGGIVKEMLVAAGDKVTKGQLLARLDTAQASADAGESRSLRLAAMAGLARVDALMAGRAPVFDEALRRDAPALVERELQLWRDAQREHDSAQSAAREAISRRRGELAEAEARSAALRTSVRLAEDAFAIEDRLYREGAGSRGDWLGAQQKLVAQRNELEAVQQSLPRLQAGLSEARAQATETDAKMRAQWGAQRTELQSKVGTLAATLSGREDKVARRELVSPMDGVVNRVLITTVGGVASPGKPILEIVPNEARLQVSVRVKPQDIGFIHVGQKAKVRVMAYDSATHGSMEAVVERVGADAVVDEKIERGEPFFEVQLTAARDQMKLHGKPLPITPGMPVEVGILTGERSVMQYMLKPVLRGIQQSLQER